MFNISNNQVSKDEISIKYIVDFWVEYWRLIFIFGAVGLCGAICFILVIPGQYEAVAQIKLAQIETRSDGNPLGVNLEDPNFVIARLKMPSAYSSKEFSACNLASSKHPAESIVGMIKVSVVKGATSIIDLRVRLQSKDQAIICLNAIFENIRGFQAQSMKPYIDQAKNLLLEYESRLKEIQSLFAQTNKYGSKNSVGYLLEIYEFRLVSNEIIRLKSVIASGETHHAKLALPIYVSDIPIFPKNKLALLVGLFVGIFLGIFLAFCRRVWRGYKVSKQCNII